MIVCYLLLPGVRANTTVFTLPQGDYRFRADLNGTEFWSGEENHCTLPGCEAASVTVSKPVTVTVAGEEANPHPELNVYAFDGDTYTGYSGTTDESGQVVFTLPVGAYRFRGDYDGVPFWSGMENTCSLPECEADAVTLPGGTHQYLQHGFIRLGMVCSHRCGVHQHFALLFPQFW